MTRTRMSQGLCLIVTAAVLIGAGLETYGRIDRPGINAFHDRVDAQFNSEIVPAMANLGPDGEWEGHAVEPTPAAIKLLRPTFMFQRQYVHRDDPRKGFMVLMNQSRNARYMLGHYPPVCYRGQGWKLSNPDEPAKVWAIGDLTINAMEYHFRRDYEFTTEDQETNTYLIVRNFMMLPDNRTVWRMEDVDKYQEDYRKRGYGAAQMQVVFYGDDTTQEFRDEVTTMVVLTLEPLIQTILHGVVEDE